ncbi:MAG: hypothetical protein QW177_08295 [Candidatus Nitrosotenuis sp.]
MNNDNNLEYFRNRCNILEEVRQLREENRNLKEEIAMLRETVSALVARNIGAKPEQG